MSSNQWSPGRNAGDLAQTEQEDASEGHLLSRKPGWCPMKNQWVTRFLRRVEGPSDWQETVGRGKRWKATSTPLRYDPQPLPSVPGTPQDGRDFYLDEPCAAKEFVSVTPTSLAWKDRAAKFDIKLTVCQERLEKAGHRSPKLEILHSLQQVYGARKVRDYTIIDTPPFFESVRREERQPREKMDGDEGRCLHHP